jgi:hypothetical protein
MNIQRIIGSMSVLLILTGFVSAQNLSFTMHISTPKSEKGFVVKVGMQGSKMAMEPQMGEAGSMRYIMDNSENRQYMLMENNGQKMAMMIDPFDAVQKTAEQAKDPKITVTRESRSIDGYQCKKVIAETEEVVTEIWMAESAGLNYQQLYKIFNSTKGTPGPRRAMPDLKDIKGFPIEIISKDKAKAETVTIRIKDIKPNTTDAALFSMDGYKVVDMRKVK